MRTRIRAKKFWALAAVVLVAAALLPLTSCVTAGRRHFGVGVYRVDSKLLNPDVDYHQIEGVGVLIADGQLSLGYVDYRSVYAQVEDRSYCVCTPLVDFAAGEEAEKNGIEFIFGNNVNFERNE